MTKNEKGVPWVCLITLHPRIAWSGNGCRYGADSATGIMGRMKAVLIAASIKTEVRVEARDT